MQSSHTGNPDPNSSGVRQENYYDPSSADGYADMLSANACLNPHQSNFPSQHMFRDAGPSPLASPQTSNASPHPPHRTSSHGSDQAQAAATNHAFDSVESLGRIGQISLDDKKRYSSTGPHMSSPFFSAHGQSGQLAAPYGSLSAVSPDSHAGTSEGSSSSGVSASRTPSHPAANAAPQLTLGIPQLSVSDTSMDYTPVASVADSNMPSINVMAPSPSTPRAGGEQGQPGGFQDILAQLAASQNSNIGMGSIQENADSNESWLPPNTARPDNSPASMFGMTDNPETWLTSPGGDAPNRPHSADARIAPQSYSAEPTQLVTSLNDNQPRLVAPHAAGQWSSQAKRQDSYDKIRQFLRLDVDMGYQTNPKNESPTLAMFRKRANSDIGPRSPVTAGGGTAFDWSLPLAAQGQDNLKQPFGTDWDAFRTKLETQGPYSDNYAVISSLMSAMPPVPASTFTQQNTMDPSLLANSQQSDGLMFDSFVPQGSQQLRQPQQEQQQQQHQQHQQQQQQQPQIQQQQQQHQRHHQIEPRYATLAGMSGYAQPESGNEFNTQWKFPANSSPATDRSKPSRANHSRPGSGGGHRRLAQSEDLSQSRLYQGPTEDFLSRITAANGGLAPPATGRTVSSSNGAASSSMMGSARVHPYRIGHDRNHSFSSNASTSSASSASPLPQLRNIKAEDGSQPYGNIGYGMGSGTASSIAFDGSSPMMESPAVPVVTSQATQAASASRRKAEALFACPVAGCGSTFTRQYNLRGHLRSHADERPYKCEWPGCDKSFARSHDCKRHQNLHLNIKPHTCELCGKTFARLDALNRHHKSDNSGCNTITDGSSSGHSNTNSATSSGDSEAMSYHNAEADMTKHARGFGGHVL